MVNPHLSLSAVFSRLALTLVVSASVVLSGCGSGVMGLGPVTANVNQLQGSVRGGQQPIVGANIKLFAASVTGRGSAAASLLSSSVATDARGDFSLAGLFKCVKASDQVYVIATGGNAPSGTNMNHALMTALGNCGDLTSSTPISVNEVTTIASVYALAPYMNIGSYDVAANSTEIAALTSAFTTVRTLANLGTGASVSTNSIGTTPVLNKLNALSDSLASCIDSSNAAPCGAFFAQATPPSSTVVPANSIAAILDIALNTTHNVTQIYNLSGADSPFQPALSSAPPDWNLFGAGGQTAPVITWAAPTAITFGAPLSAAQLDATASVPGSFAYSPAIGTTPAAGAHTLSVIFTPTDTTTHTATATVSLVVNKATPVVTWATPAPIVQPTIHGTDLSAAQLNATASVPGSFAYSPAAGTTLATGTNTLSVTFTPTDSTDYNTVTRTVSLVVSAGAKSAPVITWAAPTAITFGTVLSTAQLDATASVPGSLAYSPAAGTTPAAGAHTLSVTFTPTDTTTYTTATAAVPLMVNKATPVVTWATPAPIVQPTIHGTTLSAAQLNATASVLGSFAYSPAAGTTLAGGTNTLSVIFTPTNSTDYNTVTKTVSLVVRAGGKSTPVITWAAPTAITFGTALSAAQLDATASVPGTLAYSPAAGTTPAAGAHTLSVFFTPTDTSTYTTATAAVRLIVNKATPVVSWATPAAIVHGTTLSIAQLNATASVPGSFAYSPAGGTTPATGTDRLSVTFTPTNSTDYNTVTKTVSLVVNAAPKSTPVITWATPAAITFGTALSTAQLDATASVAGSFAYSPAAGTTPAAGTDTLSVTFTPTDSTDNNTVTKTVSLIVNKATPVVSWATPAAIVHGTTLSIAQLNATASVPGSFAYSPAGGTTPAVGTDTLRVTFTPTNSTDYNPVTKTVSLVVNAGAKSTPVITWATPAAITFGTALSTAQLDATASVAGSFAYSPAAGTIPAAGTDTLSVTFTPTDSADFSPITATVSLAVTGGTSPSATNISIGTTVSQTGLKRLGMNLGSQDFYDSGQLLRNFTQRNPGFEATVWQSILHCVAVTATSCTDSNIYTVWPANFLQGATFEFFYGAANGQTGTVTSSTAAVFSANTGLTINFAQPAKSPAVGDFVIVKMAMPGNAQGSWWTTTAGGATFTSETTDISPNSPGKQALQINAAGSGQSASVVSYFDGSNGRNFILLNGTYTIAFRAKGLGGNNQMDVSLRRVASSSSNYFNQTVPLTSNWQDFTFNVSAAEASSIPVSNVELAFAISGANVLLDDVSLTPAVATASNPTPFRDEVVSALAKLHPGVLRYNDEGILGSSIDNILAPVFARRRAGVSEQSNAPNDVAIGLHEFLQLCQTIGAEPYFNMPPSMSPTEMLNLMQYLGGESSTPYGAIRAARGQTSPWTSVFPVIHLELGNEEWNGIFAGWTIQNPVAFGSRIATIYGAAKSSPYYNHAGFDFVMGSQAVNASLTSEEAASSSSFDSVAVAPYLFNSFNDTSSNEAIFGPMFAQPEMIDSVSSGYMYQQAQAAKTAGTNLVVYEEQLSTLSGTASQSMVNAVVPSVGGGIAVADHMLLQMRDLGVKVQNVYELPGIVNSFTNRNGGTETSPLFGTVIDMGGPTNLRRPVFLAEQLVNTGILPDMLAATLSGANPTWDQPHSTNDSIQLNGAHELQTFAFSDGGNNRSLIMINLSRTAALPVTFSGANAPTGTIAVGQLTSANLTDTNETTGTVDITNSTLTNFQPTTKYSLPPFSLTVFTWVTQ